MDVLISTEITPEMLVSTDAPERLPGQVEWSAIEWPAGSVVTLASTRRVYRAAFKVPAGGVPPSENIATAPLPLWVDIGPMNQWGMFDGQVRTQTENTGDLTVVVRPGAISSIWLGNLAYVTGIRVVVRDGPGGNVVYDETQSMYPDIVDNWWDYWFAPFTFRTDALFSDIPAYSNCEVEITFEAGGAMAVGMAAMGIVENWGCTEWGVDADYNNYSSRSLGGTWGPTQGTGGDVTKDISYRIFVKPDDAPRVDTSTKNSMKRPAIYMPSGKPEFAGIRIFGQAISAHMGYPHPNYVPLDITVREFL